MPPRSSSTASAARPWVLAAWVALAAAAAYLPILANGLAFDDAAALPAGSRMHLLLHPSTYLGPQYFTISQEATYRPAVTLSYGIDYLFFGRSTVGGHLTNLLWHALASALLVPVCFSLGARRRVALAAGLLYAVHPLRSEAVCSVGFREDLLCAAFILAAVALWPAFLWLERERPAFPPLRKRPAPSPERERPARTRLAQPLPPERFIPPPSSLLLERLARMRLPLALAAFVLALLSKEMALSFPLLVLAKDLRGWRRGAPRAKDFLKRRLPWHIAAFSLTAGALTLFLTFHGESAGFVSPDGIPLARRVMGFCWIVVRYLGLFLWPHPLSVDHAIDLQGAWVWPAGAGSALALLALGVFCFFKRTAFPAAWHSFVAFLILLGPVSNVIRLDHPMAERYLTLPLAPLCYLAACLIDTLRSPVKRWGGLAATLAVLAVTSWSRCQDWKSSLALWTAEVGHHNPSSVANNNLGLELNNRQRFQEAVPYLKEALRLWPGNAAAAANLGQAYAALGQPDLAEKNQRLATELRPDVAIYHAALADFLVKANRFGEAEEECRQAMQLGKDHVLVCVGVGSSRLRMGNLDGADEALRAAAAADPEVADTWADLAGWVLAQRHQFSESLPLFDKALRLNPDLPNALEGQGFALEGLGRLDEALHAYAHLVDVDPQSPRNYWRLGKLLARMGRAADARRCLEQGIAVAAQAKDAQAEKGMRQVLDRLQ